LSLFPNPANDLLNIKYNISQSGNGTIMIYDVLGKLIYNEIISATSGINIITIPVKELSAGYYRIKLETGGMSASTPFMKE